MSKVASECPPGAILAGKYRVDSVLGQGGMGIVVAATHLQLDQRVAIKVLLDGDEDDAARARFAREAKAASKIRSEHVARVLDVGELDSGAPFMVMEYLVGEDLARALRTRGALPVPIAVSYVLEVCEALAEAHHAGIVHRDLKPANVFLARRADGSVVVKLLDFGVSKVSAAAGAATTGDAVLGSPAYMAPEQIRASRDVDARADLWALGALLFEMLSGRPPFSATGLPQLFARILEEPAPTLTDAAPHAPRALGAIVARCLEKRPDARFASLSALAHALQPFGPPEARVSVERVTRILSSAPRSDPWKAAVLPDSARLRLQDAPTFKSDEDAEVNAAKSSGAKAAETADSVVASLEPTGKRERSRRGLAVGIAALVAIAGTVLVLRPGRLPSSPATAEPSPASAQPAVSTVRVDPEPAASTIATAAPEAPASAPTPPPSVAAPTPPARPSVKTSSSKPARAPATPAETSSAPAPAWTGTDGFGSRQ